MLIFADASIISISSIKRYVTRKLDPSPYLSIRDSEYNSSSTEAGVLVPITGHGLTPPIGSTYYHWWRDPAPPLQYPPGKREPAYFSGGFSSVYSRCLPEGYVM
ncbi:hypothetical protein AVEN_259763-1 [Araneus ventricosus]|uniref:Uncharacterized protein n=1 Tax=Araneus ventricosus TaxID=182803 RepID=A0A4Y2D521_ARAVE|nr:hypothetical protein AVEN_259763-1 [Araneus ventricosus]